MILPIYLYGHPVLRKISPDITPDFPGLGELVENMKATMYASDGIGIAAPQVGVNARIVYIDAFPELADSKYVLPEPAGNTRAGEPHRKNTHHIRRRAV